MRGTVFLYQGYCLQQTGVIGTECCCISKRISVHGFVDCSMSGTAIKFCSLKQESQNKQTKQTNKQYSRFLISNFRRVTNVTFFPLGDSPASEFYVSTFRNTLFHLHRWCKQEEYKSPDIYKFIDVILPVTSCILIGG